MTNQQIKELIHQYLNLISPSDLIKDLYDILISIEIDPYLKVRIDRPYNEVIEILLSKIKKAAKLKYDAYDNDYTFDIRFRNSINYYYLILKKTSSRYKVYFEVFHYYYNYNNFDYNEIKNETLNHTGYLFNKYAESVLLGNFDSFKMLKNHLNKISDNYKVYRNYKNDILSFIEFVQKNKEIIKHFIKEPGLNEKNYDYFFKNYDSIRIIPYYSINIKSKYYSYDNFEIMHDFHRKIKSINRYSFLKTFEKYDNR